MMPELYLADALGAVGKPMLRVHTAGSVGGSTAVVATHHVSSGRFRARPHGRVGEAVRVQRHVGAVGEAAVRPAGRRRRRRVLRPDRARLHQEVRRPARHRLQGRLQGPPQRAEEPLRPPAGPRPHLRGGGESPLLWDPIRYHETCPSSDGAAAMVLVSEDVADTLPDHPVAWIHGTVGASEPTSGRGATASTPGPARVLRRGLPAGRDHRPATELDCAELYVPFSWFEPMWLESHGIAPRTRAGS
jgi:acetyl-CoA C-acetyltransferase